MGARWGIGRRTGVCMHQNRARHLQPTFSNQLVCVICTIWYRIASRLAAVSPRAHPLARACCISSGMAALAGYLSCCCCQLGRLLEVCAAA